MKLEIIVPDEHLGDVMNDLNGRRGRIREIEAAMRCRLCMWKFRWQKCSRGYADAALINQGPGSYTMEPYRFKEAVPESMQETILNR